jgi:transcriptional regulator with XRE-family HTH domain
MNENRVMAKKNEIDEKYVYRLISSNIKRLRSINNMSQLTLALNTGLTHNFINDIENCKKGVSAKTLAKLSMALNAEPYQFLLPDGMANNEVISYVKDFNDSLQKVVSELTQQYITESNK